MSWLSLQFLISVTHSFVCFLLPQFVLNLQMSYAIETKWIIKPFAGKMLRAHDQPSKDVRSGSQRRCWQITSVNPAPALASKMLSAFSSLPPLMRTCLEFGVSVLQKLCTLSALAFFVALRFLKLAVYSLHFLRLP